MLGIVDLEPAHIDLDGRWNGIGATAHLDRVGDDADRAAALHARRLVGVQHVDRDVDADRRALAKPHEIHMQRKIAHGIQLEIAGNDAVLHAVNLDVVHGREKVPGIDAMMQIGVIERDRQRRFAVAVDDCRVRGRRDAQPGRPPCLPAAAPPP